MNIRWMDRVIPFGLLATLNIVVLVAWWPMDDWTTRTGSSYAFLNTIGRLCGLLGATTLAFGFLLNLRLPIFDRWFDGVNRAYQFHHKLTTIGFSLLLFHPGLVVMKYVPISWDTAAALLRPSTDLAFASGSLALWGFMTLMITSYYLKLPYRIWRMIHRALGVAIISAFVHIMLIPSDVAVNGPLRWILLGLYGFAVAALVYRVFAPRLLVRRRAMVVSAIRPLNHDTLEISLTPKDGRPYRYEAGQFMFISFEHRLIRHDAHPLSIVSAPSEPVIRLAVKQLGGNTSRFSNLEPNTLAASEGPFGTFYRRPSAHREVWIAGGIGITPFIGILNAHAESIPQLRLWYSVKSMTDAIYRQELESIAKNYPQHAVSIHDTSRDGLLTADKIMASGVDPSTRYYLCGPLPMMVSIRQQLESRGVPAQHIRDEKFSLDK